MNASASGSRPNRIYPGMGISNKSHLTDARREATMTTQVRISNNRICGFQHASAAANHRGKCSSAYLSILIVGLQLHVQIRETARLVCVVVSPDI